MAELRHYLDASNITVNHADYGTLVQNVMKNIAHKAISKVAQLEQLCIHFW